MPWTARGDAYFLLGRWDEALADLEQATKLDPSNKETAAVEDDREAARGRVDRRGHAKEKAPETASVVLPKPTSEAPKLARRNPADSGADR